MRVYACAHSHMRTCTQTHTHTHMRQQAALISEQNSFCVKISFFFSPTAFYANDPSTLPAKEVVAQLAQLIKCEASAITVCCMSACV